ncbi:DUF2637 domain-containing protein [Actinoplanes sp. NPDC051633]|uniref:DUF2637 domain-containing protein n=1 Tax=Actinoplanes sp. NPDC051633 TaxID=3155670 RepID=UPI0034135BC8
MPLSQLRRVRWAVRATLLLGVAASVTANVLHARDNPISQAIAAWPPLALLLTVELISRVPVHRRALAFTRFAATAVIAGIAAWVSYWHMAGVAARYGETGASPYLLPLSVDGLIVVASICLVELAGRIQTLSAEPAAAQPTAVPAVPAAVPAVPAAVPAAVPGLIPEPVAPLKPVPAASLSLAAELAGLLPHKAPAGGTTPPGESIPELKPAATKRPRATAAARSTTPRATTTARATSQPRRAPAKAKG